MSNQWVSVKDKLPKKWGAYLVFDGDGFGLQQYNENGWLNIYNAVFITHWMPLPEPPKTTKG